MTRERALKVVLLLVALIACVGWSTLAHDGVMVVQGLRRGAHDPFLVLGLLALFALALIVLAPAGAPRAGALQATTPAQGLAGATAS